MNRKANTMCGRLLLCSAILVCAAGAQDYAIDWYTMDGGGAMFTTGALYELSGTIGQPDAGRVMTGGDYALIGGFWPPVAAAEACGDCPTDANDDGETGPFDLATLLAAWGPVEAGHCLDANDDGDIGPLDLAILLAAWGPCAG